MKKIAFLLLTLLAFGCSDDEGGITEEPWTEIEIPVPAMDRMLLTEVCKSSGVPDVTRNEEFLYSNGWMTSHSSTQKFTVYGEQTILANLINFQYTGSYSIATLTDDSDNKRVYTLNEQGYATQCIYTSSYQMRQYAFSYANGYLTQVTEEVTPTDGIGKTTSSLKLSLNYKKGDLISVTAPSLTNEPFTDYSESQTNFESGQDINYYRLPCLQLLETYPLSFHQEAMFAGMLGKPTQHLVTRVSPHVAAEGSTEHTNYTYRFNGSGKPTAIHSRTIYSGGTDQDYFPNKRDISITIE